MYLHWRGFHGCLGGPLALQLKTRQEGCMPGEGQQQWGTWLGKGGRRGAGGGRWVGVISRGRERCVVTGDCPWIWNTHLCEWGGASRPYKLSCHSMQCCRSGMLVLHAWKMTMEWCYVVVVIISAREGGSPFTTSPAHLLRPRYPCIHSPSPHEWHHKALTERPSCSLPCNPFGCQISRNP